MNKTEACVRVLEECRVVEQADLDPHQVVALAQKDVNALRRLLNAEPNEDAEVPADLNPKEHELAAKVAGKMLWLLVTEEG